MLDLGKEAKGVDENTRIKSTEDVPEIIPFFNRGQLFRNRVAK